MQQSLFDTIRIKGEEAGREIKRLKAEQEQLEVELTKEKDKVWRHLKTVNETLRVIQLEAESKREEADIDRVLKKMYAMGAFLNIYHEMDQWLKQKATEIEMPWVRRGRQLVYAVPLDASRKIVRRLKPKVFKILYAARFNLPYTEMTKFDMPYRKKEIYMEDLSMEKICIFLHRKLPVVCVQNLVAAYLYTPCVREPHFLSLRQTLKKHIRFLY